VALFQDDQMVDVVTPDGRAMKVPASIAQSMQGLQIQQSAPAAAPQANPMPTTQAPTTADIPPDSVTGGRLPTQPSPYEAPPTDVVRNGEDYAVPDPTIAAQQGAPVRAAQAKKQAQAAKAQAAYAATPAGKIDSAAGAVQNAIGQQSDLAVKQADVDAAGQMVVADVYQTRNEDIAKLEQARQAAMDADAQEQEKKRAELGSLRDKIANTKIDRSADHPVLAMISVALAGLGSAMQNRYNGKPVDTTALDIFFKVLDRKAAGQNADLDRMAKIYGLDKDALTELKEKASSNLARHNLIISAEAEKAARQVEEVVARSSSDKTKIAGQQLAAQLREHAADKYMESTQYQLGFDQREKFQKQEMGYKYTALKQQGKEHDDEMQVKREEIWADMQKALAAENARSGTEAMKQMFELQKENDARGIHNVLTGGYLLKQAGIDKIKQADALEQQAKDTRASLDAQNPDPRVRDMAETRAKALEDKASQIRGDAYTYDVFRGRDPVQSGKMADQYAEGQNIMTLADDIKGIYDDTGKRWLSTNDKQAAIQAKATELMMHLKTAWQLGVLSKQDTALLNQATGGDPTKVDTGTVMHALGLDVGIAPEAFKKRLDSLTDGVKASTYNQFRAQGWDVKDPEELFAQKRPQEDSPERQAIVQANKEKTPGEAASEERNKGFVRKSLDQAARYPIWGVLNGGGDLRTSDDIANDLESSGSATHPGLSKGQANAFDTLYKSFQRGDKNSAYAADELINQGVNLAQSGRKDFAVAWLHNLRDKSPELYAKARSQIQTGDVADQLSYEEKNQAGAAITPLPMLAQQAVIDPTAYSELAQRASKGDKDAQKTLEGVMKMREAQRYQYLRK